MKIAIQHFQERGIQGKHKILSRWMSYHGITMGALSMSGHPLRRQRFVSILEDYPTIPAPYCFRCPVQKVYPTCQLACATELERSIERIGAEHIVALLLSRLSEQLEARLFRRKTIIKSLKRFVIITIFYLLRMK